MQGLIRSRLRESTNSDRSLIQLTRRMGIDSRYMAMVG